MPNLFDSRALIAHRTRALRAFTHHDFLINQVWDDIISRANDIKRTFDKTLIIGARGADRAIDTLIRTKKITSDVTVLDLMPILHTYYPAYARPYDTLPVEPHTYDLVLSVFDVHSWSDVPGMLMQMRMALKPDGVCLLAFPGGDTFYELKSAMTRAEITHFGGLSPRLHPVIDLQQMAGLMQRTGFALPVVDNTKITVQYGTLTRLLHDIRGMGETNALSTRDKRILPRKFWDSVDTIYRADHPSTDGYLNATFDIIHAIGWAPAATQQQPAKRGSGTVHLSTVLK